MTLPPDAHYLSVTEAPYSTDIYEWVGKKYFCFFQTAETGKRTPNSSVKGGANHYPRAPPNPNTYDTLKQCRFNVAQH